MVTLSEILDSFHVLSGREYTAAQYHERMRFLEAIERIAPKVLVPSLANNPRDAYVRIVDRAIADYLALPEKPTRPGFPMATPEPLEIPRLTIRDLEFSEDPLVKALADALRVWALRYRLAAPWIVDAGLQTLTAWEHPGNSVQPFWSYRPPPHKERAIMPKRVFERIDNDGDEVFRMAWMPPEIVYPPIPRGSDETYEHHEQRERAERKRWLRETGLEPKAWKQADSDWHYEALALHLAEYEPLPKLAIKFGTTRQNVEDRVWAAADLIGIPKPPKAKRKKP